MSAEGGPEPLELRHAGDKAVGDGDEVARPGGVVLVGAREGAEVETEDTKERAENSGVAR